MVLPESLAILLVIFASPSSGYTPDLLKPLLILLGLIALSIPGLKIRQKFNFEITWPGLFG